MCIVSTIKERGRKKYYMFLAVIHIHLQRAQYMLKDINSISTQVCQLYMVKYNVLYCTICSLTKLCANSADVFF